LKLHLSAQTSKYLFSMALKREQRLDCASCR